MSLTVPVLFLLSACGEPKLTSAVATDLVRAAKSLLTAGPERQVKPFIFDVAVSSVHASDRQSFLILAALTEKGYASPRSGGDDFWVYAIMDGVDGYGGTKPSDNIIVFPSKGSCIFQSVTGVSQNAEKGVIEAAYDCTNTATALYQVMHDTAMKAGAQKCSPDAYRPADPLNEYDLCAVTEGPNASTWTEKYTFAATKWDTGWRLDEKQY